MLKENHYSLIIFSLLTELLAEGGVKWFVFTWTLLCVAGEEVLAAVITAVTVAQVVLGLTPKTGSLLGSLRCESTNLGGLPRPTTNSSSCFFY